MMDDIKVIEDARGVVAAVHAAVVAGREKRLGATRIGASAIGKDPRTVWLKWRWCMPQVSDPRILSIFRLGDLLETEVVRMLRAAGVEIHDIGGDGQQHGFTALAGHYAMRLDGVCRGLPYDPLIWHLLEIKSMASKYFKQLEKNGLQSEQPQYYAQVQAGMFHSRLDRALVVVYDKDTSAIYAEIVHCDEQFGASMVTKATDVALCAEPPESSYRDRSDWRAKMMAKEEQAIYWGDEMPPTVNCRNCRFSAPILQEGYGEGAWSCARYGVIDRERQRAGCADHNWIPALVPAKALAVSGEGEPPSVAYESGGVKFWNVAHGAPAAQSGPAYTSTEVAQLARSGFSSELIEDPLVNAMRDEFGATFTSAGPVGDDEIPF